MAIGFGVGAPPGEENGFIVRSNVDGAEPQVWVERLIGGVKTYERIGRDIFRGHGPPSDSLGDTPAVYIDVDTGNLYWK